MKAIRTIVENPKYREWVVMADYGRGGEIATSSVPQLFPDTCTLESMIEYWTTQGEVFNPTNIPIEMVDIEFVVKQDKDPYEHHELDMKFVKEVMEQCEDIEVSLRK